mmetsp:Transcript_21567/g.42131  ORF Transcript_21567/g.42131 Transcript_21567/m.42131 type:complete len:312 (-) Transcript_21567:714-1649(-)
MSASPMETFRTTLHFLMSNSSVIAMVDLQTYTSPLCEAKVEPAVSLIVTQPWMGSLDVPTLRCTSEETASSRGPSSNSKTSSTWRSRIFADASSNFWYIVAFPAAQRNGFSRDFKEAGPMPTLRVTQPSIPSRTARPRTRFTCASPSSLGPSRTSNSSPCSSFRMTADVPTLKSEVIGVSFSHFVNSCSALAKPGFLKPWRPNSLKTNETSCFVRGLPGKLSTNLTNMASVTSGFPLDTKSNSSSTLLPEALADERSTSRACFVADFTTPRYAVRTASVAVRNFRSCAVALPVSLVSSTRASSKRLRALPL